MTTKHEGVKVNFNLFALRRMLELEKNRSYTWEDIADGAGLHINTIYGMSGNTSKRVDLRTMAKLINFFNREGLEVGPGDLFTLEEINEAA